MLGRPDSHELRLRWLLAAWFVACGESPSPQPVLFEDLAHAEREGGHFVSGVAVGRRFIAAGVFDGVVAFEPVAGDLAMHAAPDGECVRLVYTPTAVYCTVRGETLHVYSFDEGLGRATGHAMLRPMRERVALDGAALDRQTIYAAAHRDGIAAIPMPPTEGAGKLLPVPAGYDDVWDVAVIGDDLLAVAAGANGLRVLDVSQQPPVERGALPLPGLSIAVVLANGRAHVGAVHGGGHVVDLADPARPTLVATLDVDEPIYDLRPVGDVLLAAAGEHVVAASMQGDEAQLLGASAAPSYALGVAVATDRIVYVAAFQSVLQLRVNKVEPGAALLTPSRLDFRDGEVVHIPFRNEGVSSLHVDGVNLLSDLGVSRRVIDPFDLVVGEARMFDVTIRVPHNEALLEIAEGTDKGAQRTVHLFRTGGLRPGDRFPTDIPLATATGAVQDVAAMIAGRVGVVIIGAPSCQNAYIGVRAATDLLSPLVAAGSIVAIVVDPWDDPRNDNTPELHGYELPVPILFSSLTVGDNHDHSVVLDRLGQHIHGPPMPVFYVVGRDGIIVSARFGFQPRDLLAAITGAP